MTNNINRNFFANIHEGKVSPIDVKIGAGASEKTITISDDFHPTVQNLIDLGKLPPNFRDKTPFGGAFKIELAKVPAGCVAPNCNIDGIVVLDSPFTVAGVVDEARLGTRHVSMPKRNALERFNLCSESTTARRM